MPELGMAQVKPLSDKQKKFCCAYFKNPNATKAALKAGYSTRTAYSQGQRLLKNAEIKKDIAKRLKSQEKRTEITADIILTELGRLAFSQLPDFIRQNRDKSITLKQLQSLTPDQKACISEISEYKTEAGGRKFKIKLWDKLKALEMLGKHKKLFTDLLDLGGRADLLEVLSRLGGGNGR